MPNKLKCASVAALCCCALLCPTVALSQNMEGDYFSSGAAQPIPAPSKSPTDKSPLSMRKIRTRFTEPVYVDVSNLVSRGDVFSGFDTYVAKIDVQPYLDAEPADFGANDPFASWLYIGPDPTKFEVGQPRSTYVEHNSSTDGWAKFFAGKGPRPIKLSPYDEVAAETFVQPVYEPQTVSPSTTTYVDAFSAGDLATGSEFFSSGSDSFSSGLSAANWFRGDRFSSRSTRTKQTRFSKWNYWNPGAPYRLSRATSLPKPGPSGEEKGITAKAGVLPEPRWPDSNLPLKVYISGTVAAARDGLISHEIKTALREWRDASNGRIHYVLTDSYALADIVFVCDETSGHQWAENVTEYHKSMYDRVRVSLLQDTLLTLDPKRVRGLCLHEVGHAFGIRNHSIDRRDAMSLGATDNSHPVLNLSNNDRKLIAKLYP